MRIEDSVYLEANVKAVWEGLHNGDTLFAAIPNCESVSELGIDVYEINLVAGVSKMRGKYTSAISRVQANYLKDLILKIHAKGIPGTIDAEMRIHLSSMNKGTQLSYVAEAVLSGAISKCPKFMLNNMARMTTNKFFKSFSENLFATTY